MSNDIKLKLKKHEFHDQIEQFNKSLNTDIQNNMINYNEHQNSSNKLLFSEEK